MFPTDFRQLGGDSVDRRWQFRLDILNALLDEGLSGSDIHAVGSVSPNDLHLHAQNWLSNDQFNLAHYAMEALACHFLLQRDAALGQNIISLLHNLEQWARESDRPTSLVICLEALALYYQLNGHPALSLAYVREVLQIERSSVGILARA